MKTKLTYKCMVVISLLLCFAFKSNAQSATVITGAQDMSGLTEYAQYLYIGPSAVITLNSDWTISSQYVFISPGAQILGTGNMIVDNPAKFGTIPETATWAGQPTTIDGGNDKIIAPLLIRNPNNALLKAVATTASSGNITTANASQTLYIGTNLKFATVNGDGTAITSNDVALGDNDLKVATAGTITTYSPTSFVITNGTGHLYKESYTGNFVYPVGITDGDYTPAAINNTAGNAMHVSVQNYTTSASDESTGVTPYGEDRTWNIYSDAPTGNSSINLQHNTTSNQGSYSDTKVFVTRWSNATPNNTGDINSKSAWDNNSPGAGTTGTLSTGSGGGAVAGSSMINRSYTDFATAAATSTASYTKQTAAPVTNLSPGITFKPNTTTGTTAIGVVLTVYEVNNVASSGLITVYITKFSKYVLAFNSASTIIQSTTVNNAVWSFDGTSNANYYILTTNSTISGNGNLAVGLTASLNPQAQKGNSIITGILLDGSGGENDNTDNSSASQLNFTP